MMMMNGTTVVHVRWRTKMFSCQSCAVFCPAATELYWLKLLSSHVSTLVPNRWHYDVPV